mgnify:CR=1 FL=1
MNNDFILAIGKQYWTKSGIGDIIPFTPTDQSKGNPNIWYDGFCARHIRDIEETKEQAAFIKYGGTIPSY